LGRDKINALAAERREELLVVLEDFKGYKRYELYGKFAFGNDNEKYLTHSWQYNINGTAVDSLRNHHGMQFSTCDRDNAP